MHPIPRLLLNFSCLAALGAAGCAANGGAPAAGLTTASSLHEIAQPHYLPTRFGARPDSTSSEGVQYQGGPVLVDPRVYLIFWGYKTYGDPDNVAPLLSEYVKVMGGSGHNNIYTQYYEESGSQKIYITNPTKQLGGIWYDQTNKVPKRPTDQQVAQEAAAGALHFGGYNGNDLFIVATPHGRSTSGFGTQWCAYHANSGTSAEYLAYINLPYMPDGGGNCGAGIITASNDENTVDEGVTIVTGSEEGDTVTDPVSGTGWYGLEGGEIGSACAWIDIKNDRFGKKHYAMGPMWSNASMSCVQTYK